MKKIILEKRQMKLVEDSKITAAINPSSSTDLSNQLTKSFTNPNVKNTQVNADATDDKANNNNTIVDINATNPQDASMKIKQMNNTPNIKKLGVDNVTYNIQKESVSYSKKELNQLLKTL